MSEKKLIKKHVSKCFTPSKRIESLNVGEREGIEVLHKYSRINWYLVFFSLGK